MTMILNIISTLPPETFLVSAGSALFPDCDVDRTVSVRLAHRGLLALSVAPEECTAGVAGQAAIVTP